MSKKVRILVLLFITFLVTAFLAFHFIPVSEFQVAVTGTLVVFSGMILYCLGQKLHNAFCIIYGVIVSLLGLSVILSLFPPIF